MNLGNLALTLALAGGTTALPAYYRWARGRSEMRGIARSFTVVMALGVIIAAAFQMFNILTHQFQYEYVTNFSDRSLPTLLLAASFWGGQSGSFLLWALWSVLFALILIAGMRRSSWEPFVLTPYLLVTLCVVAITLASGPFKLLAQTPADGKGLNPLLQNYWMAIHPPILFTGFTTMAGPFAFAIAALWKRDFDGWVRQSQPWTLLAWICMGTGLALGGFWAYESLGWGGYWGWDPVENSSLVPWLFASALLHGLILQRSRGSFKRTNLLLAIFGYLTVIYSTFLTRSGILGTFSVHSFVELGLMGYLVAFIVVFAALGCGMIIWRWSQIGQRVIYQHVLSREFGLVVAITLFVLIALIVGIATSMPVISLLPFFASQVSVELDWFGPNLAPFGFLMLLVMGVGPLLGWQRSKFGPLLELLVVPALLTLVALFAALLLNVRYPLALLFIAAAVFATTTNVAIIVRIWRAGPLHLGGYLAHIGVGVLFLGVVGSSLYKQTAALQLMQDSPQTVFGRQWTFRGVGVPPTDVLGRQALQIEVTNPQNGTTWLAEPPYYIDVKSAQLVTHPAIESNWVGDLYIAPSEYRPAPQLAPGVLQLQPNQPQELSGYRIMFQNFELPNREAMMRGEGPAIVEAVLAITAPDGTTTTVKPRLEVVAGEESISEPVAFGDGATVKLAQVNPSTAMATVQFDGVDLSTVNPDDLKSRAFIEVSYEPGIRAVWAGIILGILGGFLALVRRWREGRASIPVPASRPPKRAPQRPRTPVPQTAIAQFSRDGELG